MKAPLASLLLSASLFASEPPKEITTTLGKTFTGVRITAVEPDGLRIMHSGGAAKVKFSDLPEPLQKQYGYDPAKAQAFEANQSAQETARLAAIQSAKSDAAKKAEAMRVDEQKAQVENFRPITAENVRALWLRSIRQPASLDRDFKAKVEQNEALKAAINAGELDDEARRTALEYNASKLLALGRGDEAKLYQLQLIELEKAIAKREEAAAERASAEALNNYSDVLRDIFR
jgi:hypothetical protein